MPVKTVQVNVKELTCIPCVMHLELVLMDVLVLQSFLAVSDPNSLLAISALNQLWDLVSAILCELDLSSCIDPAHLYSNSHCVFRLYIILNITVTPEIKEILLWLLGGAQFDWYWA